MQNRRSQHKLLIRGCEADTPQPQTCLGLSGDSEADAEPAADPAYTAWRDAIHARHVRDLATRLETAEALNRALVTALHTAIGGGHTIEGETR